MSTASYVLNVQQFGKLIFRGVISKKGRNAEPLKVEAKENATYVVTDIAGKPVTKVVVKKKGADLLVFLGGSDDDGAPDLVLENYAQVQGSTAIGTKTSEGFSEYLPGFFRSGQLDLDSGESVKLKAEDGLWGLGSVYKSPWFVPGALLAVAGVAAATKSSSADASSSSSSDISPITQYALSTANVPAPDTFAYRDAGITGVDSGNLALVNSGVQRVKADTLDKIKTVVEAAAKIVAKANGTDPDTTTDDPTLADYQALKLNLFSADVNAAQLGLLTDIIKHRNAFEVNTAAKIEALAAITEKLFINAKDSTPPTQLTLAELQSIGLVDITANNLAGYLSAIRASANDGSNIKTFSALKAISDAYLKIFNLADGTRGNADPSKLPTAADYAVAGVVLPDTIKNDPNAIKLLNDTLDGLGTSLASKVLRITDADANNNLTDVALGLGKVMQIRAASDLVAAKSVGISAAELNGLLGSSIVTNGTGATGNLDAIVAALHASKNVTLDAHAKLLAAVSLGVVMKFADSAVGDASRVAPTLAQYQAAGLASTDVGSNKGVNATNLASLNSAVDALSSSDVDSKDKLQTILNTYMKILGMADGNRDNDKADLADYTAVGALKNYDPITGAINGSASSKAVAGPQKDAALSLINSVVDGLFSSGVDEVGELNKVAIAADKVLDLANGVEGVSLTAVDLSTLGLSGVTNANLNKIVANIKATTSADGQKVDTVSALQALVSLSTIQLFAEDRSQATPTLQTYKDLQMEGITWDSTNLVLAVNDALPPTADKINLDELKDISVAYQAILKEAGDTTGVNVDPTKLQYAKILGDSYLFTTTDENLPALNTSALNLMNEVVRKKSSSALIDVSALGELGDRVDLLMKTASEKTDTPIKTFISFADLSFLGFNTNGWSNASHPNKISKVNELIRATEDDGRQIQNWIDIQNILNSQQVLGA